MPLALTMGGIRLTLALLAWVDAAWQDQRAWLVVAAALLVLVSAQTVRLSRRLRKAEDHERAIRAARPDLQYVEIPKRLLNENR